MNATDHVRGATTQLRHEASSEIPTRRLVEPAPLPESRLLPHAPADEEVYAFFGRQGRSLMLVMNLAALITLITLAVFAVKSPFLYPLLVFICLSGLGSLLSLATSVQRRRSSRTEHDRLVAEYSPETWPSVDVFLPTCGEPLEILVNTYQHVAELQWKGKLSPIVLDDADRTEVAEAAARFGFDYHVRPNRGHMKKAGNLAYGYSVTAGDVILILDADFVPRPDLLTHLMPYAAVKDVGIVQSPQVFDATARMGWLERGAGAVQELFYRFIQPSRDAIGAAICVGTSALYKREALDANGGFANIDHSEDIYTGLELQEHGYQLRYVPVQVSKGLAPNSVASFISQQYRWCQGSISLLLSKRFHVRRMNVMARMAHWSGFIFYLTTAIGSIITELPGLIALFFFAGTIEPWFYLGLLPAVWVKAVMLPLAYRSSIRFEVQRVEMIVGFANLFAVFDTVRGSAAVWVPTSSEQAEPRKGGGGMRLPRKVALFGVLLNSALVVAMGVAFTSAVLQNGIMNLWMSGLLILLFAYIAIPVTWQLLPVAFPALDRSSIFLRTDGSRRIGPDGRQSPMGDPMMWPEAAALTAIIVCAGVAAISY